MRKIFTTVLTAILLMNFPTVLDARDCGDCSYQAPPQRVQYYRGGGQRADYGYRRAMRVRAKRNASRGFLKAPQQRPTAQTVSQPTGRYDSPFIIIDQPRTQAVPAPAHVKRRMGFGRGSFDEMVGRMAREAHGRNPGLNQGQFQEYLSKHYF